MMNLKEFTRKAAAGIVTGSIMFGMVAPAFAATRYENIPVDGFRMSFMDADSELADYTMDFDPRDDVDTYSSTWTFYGNAIDDDEAENAYDSIQIEFGTGTGELNADLDAVAIITEDASSSNKKYNVHLLDITNDGISGTGGYMYENEISGVTPNNSVGAIENLLENEVVEDTDSTVTAITTADYNSTTGVVTTGAILSEEDGSAQVGDPDLFSENDGQATKMWIYISADGEQKVFEVDNMLGSAKQYLETDAVSNLAVKARGTRTRVEFGAPADAAGITDYRVTISGDVDAEYLTKSQILYVDGLAIDDTIDVEVCSLNAEGEDNADGCDEVTGVDIEAVDVEDALSDLASAGNFVDTVKAVYLMGIADGFSDGTYGPAKPVTRDAMAKFLTLAFDVPMHIPAKASFSDVPTTHGFFGYIETIYNAGITTGSNGKYMPSDSVTREQMGSFLARAGRQTDEDSVPMGGSTCFPDLGATSVHAQNICGLVDVAEDGQPSIIKGLSNGNFDPKGVVTRGQMSAFIVRGCGMIPVDGTDIDGDDDVDAYCNFNGDDAVYGGTNPLTFPFVAPAAVEDLDSDSDETVPEVTLTWDDKTLDDDSVRGYMVYRKESAEADTAYDVVDSDDTTDPITDGFVAYDHATGGSVTAVDNDVNDDTSYTYKVCTMKWIPVDLSVDAADYSSQSAMETGSDTTEAENMIIGECSTKTERVPADD